MAADKPHEAYIKAVSAALGKAGFKPGDWWAELDDPLDAWIELAPVGVYEDADEFGLGWSEVHGWFALTIKEGAGWNKREGRWEDARNAYYLSGGILPSPETVVEMFAEMAGVDAEVPSDNFPDLLFADHSTDDEDPDFEAALAAYRTEGAAE